MFSLFVEQGPLEVASPGANATRRKYPWSDNHHLLYIDSPVGTGFSFTDSDSGYAKNQQDVTSDLMAALRQFFTLFSEYKSNDLYLTGESYAGKYVHQHIFALERKLTNRKSNKKVNMFLLSEREWHTKILKL